MLKLSSRSLLLASSRMRISYLGCISILIRLPLSRPPLLDLFLSSWSPSSEQSLKSTLLKWIRCPKPGRPFYSCPVVNLGWYWLLPNGEELSRATYSPNDAAMVSLWLRLAFTAGIAEELSSKCRRPWDGDCWWKPVIVLLPLLLVVKFWLAATALRYSPLRSVEE